MTFEATKKSKGEPVHIISIIGTRPEAIKMAPLVKLLVQQPWVRHTLMLSGQHRGLLDQALREFDLVADCDLDLMQANQKLGGLTGRAFIAMETELERLKPDLVLAQGDTTTVMVAAMSCFYQQIAFGHVEAGLRTGDLQNPFPEEFNRIVAGTVADLHFAPTSASANALRSAKVPESRIFTTGNTVIDALQMMQGNLPPVPISLRDGERLILVTAHRRENFGSPLEGVFRAVLDILERHEDVKIAYPVHPNPRVSSMAQEMLGQHPRVHLLEPQGYLTFLSLMNAASIILTDSGGVQEEAPALRKPVLVLREETERPEAVAFHVAKLIGTNPARVISEVEALLTNDAIYRGMSNGASPYGDGLASARIVQAIADWRGIPTGQDRLADFNPTGS